MNPVNQPQPPVGGIQPHHPRTQAVEPHPPGEQGLGEAGIVGIGRGDNEEERQTRAPTDERMRPKAAQEGSRMVSGGVTAGGIGITAPPGKDRRAVDDQIAGATQPAAPRAPGG